MKLKKGLPHFPHRAVPVPNVRVVPVTPLTRSDVQPRMDAERAAGESDLVASISSTLQKQSHDYLQTSQVKTSSKLVRTPSGPARLLRQMRDTLALVTVVAAVAAGEFAAGQQPAQGENPERQFLSRIRRLTVEGRRAGEGYWSPNGQRLVFQSEREPGNPFYQIYTVDLTTGETLRISPGMGKTTCAFFRPGSDQILFSSTHHDPNSKKLQDDELAFRASGKERRYAWDYDEQMEIYALSEKTKELQRLTNVRGYDAEASYSPDGQWIAFSSMRDAYNRTLTDAEKKQLGVDPSFFGEIYIMRADGTGQRRLTHVNGYDGGPFFSPDGKRIVWRRFDEQGLIADVWTMNLDGSDQRQVTHFKAMSWAPYIHPSGEYILFASNKLGFENFEVFMVDLAGTREPVRVTHSDGFDGLPVPSPDGTQLAWTTSRGGGREGQIFLAQWNHQAALKALQAAPPRK